MFPQSGFSTSSDGPDCRASAFGDAAGPPMPTGRAKGRRGQHPSFSAGPCYLIQHQDGRKLDMATAPTIQSHTPIISSPQGLTGKQCDLLSYLQSCQRTPSFEEMKVALGLKSKSGVHRLVEALEERGFIFRRRNRARAIIVRSGDLAGFTNEEIIVELIGRGVFDQKKLLSVMNKKAAKTVTALQIQ
mgnify:CR=1 FL=1